MLLTLIRHGEVTGRPQVLRGRSDPQLTRVGWEQLVRTFSILDGSPPERLITSPSRRCHEFALHWTGLRKVPLSIDNALREIDFGEWEELSPEEANLRDPELYVRFIADPEHWRSPGGESYGEFRERVLSALENLRDADLQHAAMLTHAGVMRVLIADVLGIRASQALRIALGCASCCRVWLDGPRSQLLDIRQGA